MSANAWKHRKQREKEESRLMAMIEREEVGRRCHSDGHDYCDAAEARCPCNCHKPLSNEELFKVRELLEREGR